MERKIRRYYKKKIEELKKEEKEAQKNIDYIKKYYDILHGDMSLTIAFFRTRNEEIKEGDKRCG